MTLPRFSVIVPTYARPERLANCLEALAGLDYPRHAFEVVVVDDGSPAPVAERAAPFRDRLDLTLLRQANRGPAASRNAAARLARYELLAFTDDDCAPRPDWLGAFARGFIDNPDALLGGRTVNALERDRYASASQGLVDYLYVYYGAERGAAPFFTSNNMAAPRQRFLDLGGFDETFPRAAAEDREFGMRWRDRFGPLRFVSDAVVAHAHAMTLRRFWRQHANYGSGARHLARLGRQAGRPRHRVEPAMFYLGLVTHPLRRSRSAASAEQSLLLILSQFAMVWGYIAERVTPTTSR